MRKIFLVVMRAAIWVALVIIAVNIEGIASFLGINNLLSEHAPEVEQMLKELFDFLRWPPLFYMALVLLGASLEAWSYALIGKLEQWKPAPPLWIAATHCRAAANGLLWYRFQKYFGDVPKQIEKANNALNAHGIATIQITDLEDAEQRERAARHFKAIEPLLSKANVAHARTLSEAIASDSINVIPVPPAPQDTGAGR